jgi:hypothetical protein
MSCVACQGNVVVFSQGQNSLWRLGLGEGFDDVGAAATLSLIFMAGILYMC